MKKDHYYLAADHWNRIYAVFHNSITFLLSTKSIITRRISEQEIEMIKTNVFPAGHSFLVNITEITKETAEQILLKKLYSYGKEGSEALPVPKEKEIVTIVTQDQDQNCLQCGNLFTPKSKKAVFCSNGCRVAAHREKRLH